MGHPISGRQGWFRHLLQIDCPNCRGARLSIFALHFRWSRCKACGRTFERNPISGAFAFAIGWVGWLFLFILFYGFKDRFSAFEIWGLIVCLALIAVGLVATRLLPPVEDTSWGEPPVRANAADRLPDDRDAARRHPGFLRRHCPHCGKRGLSRYRLLGSYADCSSCASRFRTSAFAREIAALAASVLILVTAVPVIALLSGDSIPTDYLAVMLGWIPVLALWLFMPIKTGY